jgi:hypothetical protein
VSAHPTRRSSVGAARAATVPGPRTSRRPGQSGDPGESGADLRHPRGGQTDCGRPRSRITSGLVGYVGDEPVGWCAVEPRPAYRGRLSGHLPLHPGRLSTPRRVSRPRQGRGHLRSGARRRRSRGLSHRVRCLRAGGSARGVVEHVPVRRDGGGSPADAASGGRARTSRDSKRKASQGRDDQAEQAWALRHRDSPALGSS